MDKDWTSNLKVGDSVKLRFPGVSDSTVSALVATYHRPKITALQSLYPAENLWTIYFPSAKPMRKL